MSDHVESPHQAREAFAPMPVGAPLIVENRPVIRWRHLP